MAWDTDDVYYQPEKFGLKMIGEVDFSDGNYCFDYRAVWLHEDGTLYTARDAGCSCPSPFETFTSLEKLDKWDRSVLLQEVENEAPKPGHPWYRGGNENIRKDAARLLELVAPYEH